MPIIKTVRKHPEIEDKSPGTFRGKQEFASLYAVEGKQVQFKLGDVVNGKEVTSVGLYSLYQIEAHARATPRYSMMPDVVFAMLQTKLAGKVFYVGDSFKINVYRYQLPRVRGLFSLANRDVAKVLNGDKTGVIASILNKLPPVPSFATRMARMADENIGVDTSDFHYVVYGPRSVHAPNTFTIRSFKFGFSLASGD